jgi:hypothetical protein
MIDNFQFSTTDSKLGKINFSIRLNNIKYIMLSFWSRLALLLWVKNMFIIVRFLIDKEDNWSNKEIEWISLTLTLGILSKKSYNNSFAWLPKPSIPQITSLETNVIGWVLYVKISVIPSWKTPWAMGVVLPKCSARRLNIPTIKLRTWWSCCEVLKICSLLCGLS